MFENEKKRLREEEEKSFDDSIGNGSKFETLCTFESDIVPATVRRYLIVTLETLKPIESACNDVYQKESSINDSFTETKRDCFQPRGNAI